MEHFKSVIIHCTTTFNNERNCAIRDMVNSASDNSIFDAIEAIENNLSVLDIIICL